MFAENLKNLRISYGLTQKELAEELGTSQPTYTKWENGTVSPTLASIEKIAAVFDVPVTQLVYNNTSRIEDLLEADNIDYLGIPLSFGQIEDLKQHLMLFVDYNLKHFDQVEFGKGLMLKSGKQVMLNRPTKEER